MVTLAHLGFEIQDLHDVPHEVRQLLVHFDLLQVLLHLLLVPLQVQRQAVALVAKHADLVLQQTGSHLHVLDRARLELLEHAGLAIVEDAV